MSNIRTYVEKLLFPGACGQRRRHMRFFILAVVLAFCLSLAIGTILYMLNSQGRL